MSSIGRVGNASKEQPEPPHSAKGWKNWTIEADLPAPCSKLATAFMSQGAWSPVRCEPIVAPQ